MTDQTTNKLDDVPKVVLLKEDGTKINVTYKTPSMKMQNLFMDIRTENLSALTVVQEKHAELFEILKTNATNAELSELEKVPDEKALEYDLMQAELTRVNSEFAIKFFRSMIDVRQLPTKNQELIDTEGFLVEQNIVEMQAAVTSFRMLLRV